MRKKSTLPIQLVLITAVLASCNQSPKNDNNASGQRVFMRADSTAPYTEVTDNVNQQRSGGSGMTSALLWYMAFRHLGGGMGYANNGLHPNSVTGNNVQKAKAYQSTRGGFGKTNASRSNSVGS